MKLSALPRILLWFASVYSGLSWAQTDPDLQYYKEPGIYPTRSYINQHFGENTDPFTGRLQLHYVDLYIPGNGGFDLEITRSYTNVDDSILPAATQTPFGLGWTMHFGRVLRRSDLALCDVSQISGGTMPVLELPNGSRYTLFRDDEVFPNTGGFMTTNRWRAECKTDVPTGIRVFAPNGTRYEMTQLGNAPTGQNAWYTTKITDRNSNTMSITYVNLSGSVVPSSVQTSDGRNLTFNYIGSGFGAHLTSITDGTRTWQYSYKNLTNTSTVWLLQQVTPPAGGSWQYAYKEVSDGAPGLYSIKTLTFPQGGTINYSYSSQDFTSGAPTSVFNTVVQQKSIPNVGTWTFTYQPSTGFGVNDKTTVVTPSGTTIYQHIGYNTVGVGTYWQFGLLVSKQLGSVQTETFQWGSQVISSQSNVRPGSTLASDASTNAPVLAQRSILRDGNTYNTTNSNFDNFGNPTTVAETSSGFSRTTSLTPQINLTLWIIRQIQNESLDTPGFSISRVIDPNGNVTQETKYGVVTNYTPDAQGNLQKLTNARGFPTTFSNYFRGIPQTENHPESVNVARVVSAAGNVTSETDGKGDTRGYNYDGLNRLAGTVGTGAPAINFPRPQAADISIVWTTSTRIATRGTFQQVTTYDGFGRPISIVSTDGVSPSQNSTITISYDALGRRTFQSDPNSAQGTGYSYDILDRILTVSHPDNTTRTYTYNATSVGVTNERHFTDTFSYMAFGDPDKRFLIGIAVPTPNTSISFPRNPIGQILQVTQGVLTRTYGYYLSNHFLQTITDPETGVTQFGRDQVGNMISKQVGSSAVTGYAYDGLDRLTLITYPAPTPSVTKTYYGDNTLMDVITTSATRHFEYDSDKNLTLERMIIDGGTYDITHSYNANDALNSTTYPSVTLSGTFLTYAANGFGRPTTAAPYVNSVDYWPHGELKTLAYANGVTTSETPTVRLWPGQLTSSVGGTSIANIQYGYDGVGNVTSYNDLVDSSNTMPSLIYDEIDRLKSANSTGEPARAFNYDGVGNLTFQSNGAGTLTYSYDAANRLSNISSTGTAKSYPSFSYDSYGNVTSNGNQSFTYDDASHMTCARCGQSDQSLYVYDGLDMRVRVQKAGVTTYFMYGLDGNLMMEYTPQTASGGVDVKEYAYVSGRQVGVRTIDQVRSTVTPVSGNVTAVLGTNVTITVTIGGASPRGTVGFFQNGALLGTANVVNSTATITLPAQSVGTSTIVAVFSGDSNNTGGSTTITVDVVDLSWLLAILDLLLSD